MRKGWEEEGRQGRRNVLGEIVELVGLDEVG